MRVIVLLFAQWGKRMSEWDGLMEGGKNKESERAVK